MKALGIAGFQRCGNWVCFTFAKEFCANKPLTCPFFRRILLPALLQKLVGEFCFFDFSDREILQEFRESFFGPTK